MTEHYSRRRFLASTGVVSVAALAGCTGGDGDDGGGGDGGDGGTGSGGGDGSVVVSAGPDGSLTFEPETVTVAAGDTVTWEFASASHNVCAWPDMHEAVSVPDGASGFGTMPRDGDAYATVSSGETFEYTFDGPSGEYTYVCVPHAASDMVGTVVVE